MYVIPWIFTQTCPFQLSGTYGQGILHFITFADITILNDASCAYHCGLTRMLPFDTNLLLRDREPVGVLPDDHGGAETSHLCTTLEAHSPTRHGVVIVSESPPRTQLEWRLEMERGLASWGRTCLVFPPRTGQYGQTNPWLRRHHTWPQPTPPSLWMPMVRACRHT